MDDSTYRLQLFDRLRKNRLFFCCILYIYYMDITYDSRIRLLCVMPGKMLRNGQEGPFPTSSCCSLLHQSNTRLKMISATGSKRSCMSSQICYAIYFIKDLSSALLRLTQIPLTPKHVPIWPPKARILLNAFNLPEKKENHFSEIPLDNIQNLSKSKVCPCS